MSDIPINPMGPTGEPTGVPTGGEGIAERYIDKELIDSRASLKRTQIVSVLLSAFVIGYMSYLTSGFRNSLEPHGAAQIATGLASQRLDDLEPQFASYIHEQVPQMIRKAPDEVIARMPEYRKNLEDRVVTDLQTQAQNGASQLSKDLDSFLTAHKDQVSALLKNGQDPQAVASMGDGMEQQFRTFLTEEKIGDTTLAEKLDSTLGTLKLVSGRTTKLASNQGLTPSEKTARHAIGMMMQRIKEAQATSPLPTIDTNKIQGAVNEAADTVRANLPAGTAVPDAAPETAVTATPKTGAPAPKVSAPKGFAPKAAASASKA